MRVTSLFLNLLTRFFLVWYRSWISVGERAQAYRFLASCVILGRSLNLSGPQILPLWSRANSTTHCAFMGIKREMTCRVASTVSFKLPLKTLPV